MKKWLLLFPVFLFSSPVDTDCLITQKDVSLVYDIIDPISGSVQYQSLDHIIQGAEPIYLHRSYTTRGRNLGLEGGWDFHYPSVLYCHEEGFLGGKIVKNAVYLKDLQGNITSFKYKGRDENGYYLLQPRLNGDYRNTCSPYLSGKTNPKNTTLTIDRKKIAIVTLGDGTKKIYTPLFLETDLHNVTKYHLRQEIKPNQNHVLYRYDHLERLLAIETTNPSGTKTYAKVSFLYEDTDLQSRDFTLVSTVPLGKYAYFNPEKRKNEKDFHDYFFLHKTGDCFLGKNYLRQKMTYDKGDIQTQSKEKDTAYDGTQWNTVYYQRNRTRAPFLTSLYDEGKALSFSYYQIKDHEHRGQNPYHIKNTDDARCDRIKSLSVSFQEKIATPLFYFFYELQEKRGADKDKKIRKVHVKNLYNEEKTTYYLQFNAKVPYLLDRVYDNGWGEKNHYVESYYWNKLNGGYFLEKIVFRDEAEENTSVSINYSYDEAGNVLKQTLLGNLSGEKRVSCEGRWKCDPCKRERHVQDYLQIPFLQNPVESYSLQELYEKHKYYHLERNPDFSCGIDNFTEMLSLKKKESFYYYPGKCGDACNRDSYSIEYTYDKHHNPLSKKEDNGLTIEYTYLPNTNLIASKTYKEGEKILYTKSYKYNEENILEEEILESGTTQKIYRIKKILPKETQPGINLPERIEEYYLDNTQILLSCTEYRYNNKAEVVEELVYGPDRKHLYTLFYQYAENGLLLEKTDPLGRVTKYDYDKTENTICRRIKRVQEEKEAFFEEYTYDPIGYVQQKKQQAQEKARLFTYTQNILGKTVNETDYRGQETHLSYDGKGNNTKKTVGERVVRKKYNALGQSICSVDAKGNTTYRKYNGYGKVTEIIYPDKTTEKTVYYNNGLLRSHTDPEGVVTEYTYDVLGRELSKKIIHQGKIIATEEKTYDGLLLTAETDAMGNQTEYSYDPAGRKILEEYTPKNGHKQRKEFSYDAYGNVCKEKVFNGENTYCILTQKDAVKRTVEEKTEDLAGNCLAKTCYTYDLFDNKVKETRYVDDTKTLITFYAYDSFHRLIRKWDAEENSYDTEYQDHFINENNQSVLRTIETDPLQVQTIQEYDPYGNIISTLKKNQQGHILSSEKKVYDPNDNEILLCEGIEKLIKHEKIYDCRDRLTSLIEAKDTEEERTTQYAYTDKGFIKKTLKPNGTILEYAYDCLGNQTRLFSSDKTVDYSYSYDLLGHLTLAKNNITGQKTIKKLDSLGNVLVEILENGLELSYNYDAIGRVTKITLPDGSTIEKQYDALHLKEVLRKDPNQNLLHSHRYWYNLVGGITEETAGKYSIYHSYDLLGRSTKITSDFCSQEIDQYDAKGKIVEMHYAQEEPTVYSYNDLEELVSEKGLYTDIYQYDCHRNRICKNDTHYNLNSLHQIEEMSYDKQGNLLQYDDNIFTYDALDRLCRVETPTKTVEYVYDGCNRRVKKIASGKEVLFLYEEQKEIGQVTNNTIEKLRVLGNTDYAEMGSSICIEIDKKVYIPIHDLCRNICCLVDTEGKILESYRYSAFGEEKKQTTLTLGDISQKE